jgi:epoxyqueuosine reductase
MAWAAPLVELFAWSEEEFNRKMEGSPIRRIGHERWLRNIAVGWAMRQRLAPRRCGDRGGAGSAPRHPSALVREHVEWALAQHRSAA